MKKIKVKVVGVAVLSAMLFVSCQEKSEQKEVVTETVHHENELAVATSSSSYKIGDKVPNKQVCMVNNAYMGKDQFEVPYDGKTYYGCCNMCVERIPNDETSRQAIDPFTGKIIDKANAYIVLKDEVGNVDYFENEDNYKKYSQLN